MNHKDPDLQAERVRELLDYDPTTGAFRWRELKGQRVAWGVAGFKRSSGYVVIKISNRQVAAHRLAWLYAHGRWPDGEVDHLNGQRDDNRIENLRDVPRSFNIQNQTRAQRSSHTGVLGVSRTPEGRFWARLYVAGKMVSAGYHDTPEIAHAAYVEAKRRLHPGNTL